jgi:iron complex outermembrane recepter protein
MITRDNRRASRLLTSAASGVLIMLASGTVAWAQDATDEQPEDEIVVVGIRKGIEDAIALKKDNDSIVEAISAEDIGKLPDVSIAESIARLPGLTAQRLNGRGQLISVRGLGPDFTSALLNGREQLSTGDNRAAEFDQYPSELLSSVVVYKTPDASLVAAGLAGTVDLRTIRPLSANGRQLSVGGRYEWNDLGALNTGTEDTGYRLNGAYVDQFLDGRLGVAIGVATTVNPSQVNRFNAWGYPDSGPGGSRVIGGSKSYAQSNELERTGVIGTIEFKPTPTFSTTLDAYYSEFTETQILRGVELPLAWGNDSGANSPTVLAPGATVTNGFVTSGTFNGVRGVVRNDANQRDAQLMTVGWKSVWSPNDLWDLTADFSYGKVERTDQILETYSGTLRPAGALSNIGFRSAGEGGFRFTSSLNYADYSQILLTSPRGWGGDVIPNGQLGYLNRPTVNDDLTAIRLEAKRNLETGPFSYLEGGVNFSQRSKEKIADEFFLGLAGGALSAPIPTNARLATTNLSFLGLGPIVSYDPLALLNSGTYRLVRNPNGDVVIKSWEVNEDVLTSWVKMGLDTELFGLPLTGNFGLAVVSTEQSSTAQAVSTGGPGGVRVTNNGGDEYVEFLPSANLTFELDNDSVFRVALARQMARPRMDQMNATRTVSFNTDPARLASINPNFSAFSGGGGNPQLRPWIAQAVDLSYERYFGGRKGYFSAAAFYKDLESYIFNQQIVTDFAGFPTGGLTPATTLGLYSTPANGTGGAIKGLEFSLSVPAELFFEPLTGFGVVSSVSFTESDIQPDPGQPSRPIEGLSETVGNVTVYYERAGFSARVSNRWRSDFLGEVSGFGNGREFRQVKEESVVDAQLGYAFQSGPLAGLSAVIQANNLTDEPFSTFNGSDERQVIDYQEYGTNYLIGLNYKF